MRVPRDIAWLLLALGFFTAGLLRRFHESTPASPYVHPVVGSLLFAAILFLLLVSSREQRAHGEAAGPGIRLGTLLPILLMLLFEKWASLTLYGPVFLFLAPKGLPPPEADAVFRAFAGAGLLGVCLLVSRFSPEAAERTWERARPRRWPAAAAGAALALGGAYALLGGSVALLSDGWTLRWPRADALLLWVVIGQGVLAFAEEVYYRGLLLSEMLRLGPRLGLHGARRRWAALLSTALLFGFEHLELGPPWPEALRRLVFSISLGILFGILVLVSDNLHFAAAIHASINWLLLGAAPRLADASGQSTLPAGTYVGLVLALAFVLVFVGQRARSGPRPQASAA